MNKKRIHYKKIQKALNYIPPAFFFFFFFFFEKEDRVKKKINFCFKKE